jgi:hypothetical protein
MCLQSTMESSTACRQMQKGGGAKDVDRFCPKGVGVRLADDLARSASKPCERYAPDLPSRLILLPVPGRSLASQAPTASGQNQKQAAQ